MRYPIVIKTALSQVLQGPPPAHPASMKAQQDAAAAAAAAGIVPGEEQDDEAAGKKDKAKEKSAALAKAGLPPTAKAAPGAKPLVAEVPAPGAVATPTTEKPKQPTAGFRYPRTKTAQIEVTRRMVEPTAPRTDFQVDRPMGAGETLAAQLSNSLGAQMQPRLSPTDPTISRSAPPLKHLV